MGPGGPILLLERFQEGVMKMSQRALSILLSLVMVLTFIPSIAFAYPGDEGESAEREITRIEFTHQGDYKIEGYVTNGYWDENENWIETPEPYLQFDEPWFEEGDYILVWYEGETDPLKYTAVNILDEEGDEIITFAAENDDNDIIYPFTEWVKEQTYDNPFTADTEEEFKIYIDGYESVCDTKTALLVDEVDDYVEPDDPENSGFGELPASCDSINLDQKKTVSVTDAAPVVTFAFRPTFSGRYIFRSYGNEDTVGNVRTEDDSVEFDEDLADEGFGDENDHNFLIGFEAEAGETYYLQAKAYESGNYTFEVKIYNDKVKSVALDLQHEVILYDGVNSDPEINGLYVYEPSEVFAPGDKVYVFYYEDGNIDDLSGKTRGVDYEIYEFTDGSSFMNGNEELSFWLDDNQKVDGFDGVNWAESDDRQIFFIYGGNEEVYDSFQVDSIDENPVESIKFSPDPIVLYKEDIKDMDEGDECLDLNNRGYKHVEDDVTVYDRFVNGDILKVTFRGETAPVTYTYSTDKGGFVSNNEYLPFEEPSYWGNTLYVTESGVIDDAVTIDYAGKSCYVDVEIRDGKHPHNWDSGTITRQPTTAATGENLFTCLSCGETKVETIEKLTAPSEPSAPTKTVMTDLKAVKGLKLKGAKGKITVKWKKAAKKELKTFQGYEIQYTLDGTFKDYPAKIVPKKKASVTLKKLIKKKKYTVRIRRYRDDGSVLHVSPWKVKRSKTK